MDDPDLACACIHADNCSTYVIHMSERAGFIVAFGGEPLLLDGDGAFNNMTWDDEGALESWKVSLI